jgi:hypothetical protein
MKLSKKLTSSLLLLISIFFGHNVVNAMPYVNWYENSKCCKITEMHSGGWVIWETNISELKNSYKNSIHSETFRPEAFIKSACVVLNELKGKMIWDDVIMEKIYELGKCSRKIEFNMPEDIKSSEYSKKFNEKKKIDVKIIKLLERFNKISKSEQDLTQSN